MEFRVILRKTLVDLAGPWRTLALVLAGVLLPALIFWFSRGSLAGLPLQMQVHYAIGLLYSASFLWTAGFLLAVAVSAEAVQFVSRESSEGTLLLLVSKPISRWPIVMAKLVALVLYALVVELVSLLLVALIVFFVMHAETGLLIALLKAIVWMIPYLLLVIAAFGSVAVASSALLTGRVATTLAMVFVVFVFFFAPMTWRMSADHQGNRPLDVVDMGHRLAGCLLPLMDKAEGGMVLTNGHWFLQMYDPVLPDEQQMAATHYTDFPLGSVSDPFEIDPAGSSRSLAVWLSIIAVSLVVAVVALERKEVT